VASKWIQKLANHARTEDWQSASPMLITPEGTTLAAAISESNYVLAKGRSLEKYSDVISTGLQPTRKALPQLIPDGLPPHLHLEAALAVQHPMTYLPTTTVPIKYALEHVGDDIEDTLDRRREAIAIMAELAAACEEENEELIRLCEPSVQKVLRAFGTKNIVLMRELAYLCGTRDILSPCAMLIGLPMLGWAPGAEGLMARMRHPTMTLDEFLAGRLERNEKLVKKTRASGDDELDAETYDKTVNKMERGGALWPFHLRRRNPSSHDRGGTPTWDLGATWRCCATVLQSHRRHVAGRTKRHGRNHNVPPANGPRRSRGAGARNSA
jgi:hypothetical protein